MSLLRRIEKKPASPPPARRPPPSQGEPDVQRRPVPRARDAYMDLKTRVQNRLIAEMERNVVADLAE